MMSFLTMTQWKFENNIPFVESSVCAFVCVDEDGVGRICGKVMPGEGKGKGQPVTGHEAPKGD
jgi:hypothetical protein